MKKLLIIAYYWPPSGGAGVQRWLKLSKYLAQRNIEVHVVTVDPEYASYMKQDNSMIKDVDPSIHVHRTKSFEPINIYTNLFGKENVPSSGFSNVDMTNWKQKAVTFLRSNLFIPDPRKGWNKYAYRKAVEVISTHHITHVITTSPPHSTQLVGLKLKRKFKSLITWIADFRDPWTDIYYYDLLQHSFISHRLNIAYEKKTIKQSDIIFTVGNLFKTLLLAKTNAINPDKIKVITNGFDPDDFDTTIKNNSSIFTISYVGTISNHYQPEVFFRALRRLINNNPDRAIQFKLIGSPSEEITSYITSQIGDRATFISSVSHDKAVEYMLLSDILLLVTQGKEGTIPGKTFEYLAAQKNIICIGEGDSAEIISKCEAGRSFSRDNEDAIHQYLESSLADFLANIPFVVNTNEVNKYSRASQADQVIKSCN